ncbi:MAG TPA: MarR family transcriptional regulator [Kofleriaceae bacterium]|jgi:DNA-binding MarR family transcriptional regulator
MKRKLGGTGGTEADRIWRALVNRVMDGLDDWRRRVAEATGMPFGRVRLLRRLVDKPLSLRELADAAGIDAPAATVAINELEDRGLVVREPHPTNGRMKLVSLTASGHEMVAKEAAVSKDAPPAFAKLSAEELRVLARLVALLDD